MDSKNPAFIVILFFLALFFFLCCCCALGFVSLILYSDVEREALSQTSPEPAVLSGQGIMLDPIPLQTNTVPTDTLDALANTLIPINDPIKLAERLENKNNLPESLDFPLKNYREGDREAFWVTNTDTNENIRVSASLYYITDHVYFWIEDGIDVQEKHVQSLVDTFEFEIYQTTREFFGSEWTPGVDADPHLFILYARNLGGTVAGYFSSADEFLPLVREYSNAHEMFLLSADHLDLNEEYAYSVIAHEFQHMIHWYRDRNEETWLNEGASTLASFLNGYTGGGHDRVFALNPDIQLNDWPAGNSGNTENYGAAFLFITYFLDRFGETATQALIANPLNGLSSIDDVFAELQIQDPLNGQIISADNFFLDWLITNLLQDEKVADGRYTYNNYPAAPSFNPTHEINRCPFDSKVNQVSQYGVNSWKIRCRGNYVVHIDGSQQIAALPFGPYSGDFAYYSNRGDESNMTLTREFDFTKIQGPLTLSYWTWYDLEEDYDYLYLEASTDGEKWQILSTPSGTPEDPSGNSYGWAYNGKSGGGPTWIQEIVDISEFAGQSVQLRFEYITDLAVNGEGFWIDDISVPEFGYFTDFETDAGGWLAEGFVRIQNLLPQTFQLALIKLGHETTVEILSLYSDNSLDIPVQIGGEIREIMLVISGTSRFTRQKAHYSISIQPE